VSGTLVGLVSIERLRAADAKAGVEVIMDRDAPDTDQERAARGVVDRHECSLAVVDADGRFLGLIPPYRVLGPARRARTGPGAPGGYLAGTARARGAAGEPVAQRLWHRLPWLLVGVLGAVVATRPLAALDGPARPEQRRCRYRRLPPPSSRCRPRRPDSCPRRVLIARPRRCRRRRTADPERRTGEVYVRW
jgi:hypothetical protein